MKKETYKEGHYAQIKLEDGTRIFIETLPDEIKMSKMFSWLFSAKTLFSFKFPFYIRTATKSFITAQEVLDIVIDNISNCNSINELKNNLDSLKIRLDSYVSENKDRAVNISKDELGDFVKK